MFVIRTLFYSEKWGHHTLLRQSAPPLHFRYTQVSQDAGEMHHCSCNSQTEYNDGTHGRPSGCRIDDSGLRAAQQTFRRLRTREPSGRRRVTIAFLA